MLEFAPIDFIIPFFSVQVAKHGTCSKSGDMKPEDGPGVTSFLNNTRCEQRKTIKRYSVQMLGTNELMLSALRFPRLCRLNSQLLSKVAHSNKIAHRVECVNKAH